MWIGERRRSARIFELEARKTQNKGKATCDAAEDVVARKDDSCLPPRKKVKKIRPVQDLVACTIDYQPKTEVGNSSKDHCTNAAAMSSQNALPERRKLELLLHILKRRDSHNLFGKPVNREEVKNYDDVIEEPMDFASISKKLEGGSYRTLTEFEHDVSLVWSNAMLFNLTTTIYYTQARAIRDLAKQLFDNLKKDPENFESGFSMTRQRAGTWAKTEVNILNSFYRSTNGMASGVDLSPNKIRCRGERRSVHSEVDRRGTCRPPLNTLLTENQPIMSTVCSSKTLVQTKQNSVGYEESLTWFAKDLGPTAQGVAEQKLQKCAEDLNPHNAIYLDLNVASSDEDISTAPSSDILKNSTINRNSSARMDIQGNTGQGIGRSPFMKALLGGGNSNFSATWDTHSDLKGKSVQTISEQDTGNSYLSGKLVEAMPHQHTGSSSYMNALFWNEDANFSTTWKANNDLNSIISRAADKGKNVQTAEVRSSDVRREAEKVYSQSPSSIAWLPQMISGSSQSPTLRSTPGLNSNFLGVGLHQFQPMAVRGSTHYGPNFEQAMQDLSWLRPTYLGQQPVSNNPFHQQGWNASTSETNIRAVQLSDIDEWSHGGRSRGLWGININVAPPATSQEQSPAGTSTFPWTLKL